MLSLLGENNSLPLFHMAKRFIWIEETKERINKFLIVNMINTKLNIKKHPESNWINVLIIHLIQPLNLILYPD